MFVFHNECVDNRSGHTGARISSTRWKTDQEERRPGRRLIIKMDIEGAEWDRYSQPRGVLASILRSRWRARFDDPKIVEVLRKLKRNFYLVNLHFNNWSCTPKAAPLQHGRIRCTGKQADRRARSGGTPFPHR